MRYLFTICILLISLSTFSQQWITGKNITPDNLSFAKEKELFYDFCEKNQVKNGKYTVNGVEKKLPGWKQFMRLEYRWDGNIDPSTGNPPNYNQYLFSKNSLEDGSNSEWTNLGPNNTEGGYAGLGRINVIAFHPTDNNTIFIGAPAGGLWKTTTGGNDWVPLTDQIASIGVSEIILSHDFDNDQIIYISTGDRDHYDSPSVGVLKSYDGGTTWEPTGLTFNTSDYAMVFRMLLHPDNNDILYAATTYGLYKTEDAGENWVKLSDLLFNDMEFKVDDPNVIFAGKRSYQETGIFKSTNGGQDWQMIMETEGRRTSLAVTEDNPNYVYAITANPQGGLDGIYKSTDAGDSYDKILDGDDYGSKLLNWSCEGTGDNEGQGWYDLCIAANPQNANEVYIGGVNTWGTFDGGENWECINHWVGDCFKPEVHADKHDLVYQKSTNTLFEANDGGIYKKDIEYNQWTDISNTLEISQMYKLGLDHKEHKQCITGLQDNGSKLLYDNLWYDVTGGDGMECMIDYSNTNIQYASYVRGTFYRTDNLWETYDYFMPYYAEQGNWVTPIVMSSHNPNTIIAGYNKLWKITVGETSWEDISAGGSSNVNSICISELDKDLIAYTRNNNILITSDEGSSWTNITNNLPIEDAYIEDVKLSAHNTNTLWVALSGYNQHGVYESVDGGSSWTNISDGLPEIPIYYIVQDKREAEKNRLFVATEFGIYFKNGDDPWMSFNNNLPNVPVYDLEISYKEDDCKLYAATFGRGLWATPIPAEPVSTMEAKLTKDDLWPNPCNANVCLRVNATDEQITVVSTDGKIVYDNVPSHDIVTVNTSGWKDGTYFVRRTSNDKTRVTKLIVTH